MIKKTILILMLLSLLLCCAGCSTQDQHTAPVEADQTITVGFSQVGAESDWRNANTLSMMTALSTENGFRLIIDDAQQKQERQIVAIRNFIQLGVDYIVLAPTCETGWDTVLGEAKAAGIPVIIVDRTIEVSDSSLYRCWVGSAFISEGEKAISWLEANASEKPIRIVHLQGSLGSSAQLGRTKALDDALDRHPEWTLVYRENGEFTEAKGQELVESLLASGIEFDVLYSENDNMTYGAINALKSAGRTPGDDVTIISFDASRTALELTLRGEISYEVECNPLHGPRVAELIRCMENKLSFSKLTFVEETTFSQETLTSDIIASREY